MMRTPSIKPAVAVLAGALTLGACKTFSPDGGMSVAANIADQELHKDVVAIRTQDDASSARARVQHLLKRPLTADTAVQIALLNNRGLQAAYNELGIAEAAMVQQVLPPNPSFSISRISGSVETEIDRQIVGRYSCARHAASARRDRRRIVSDKRNCLRRLRPCALRQKRGALTTAPSRRASWSTSSRKQTPPPRLRRSSPSGWARPAP